MTRTRRPSTSFPWSILLLSATIGPAPVAAQSAPGIVDLVNLPTVSSPQLSPDGTELLYVRSDADWEDNRTVGHIWRIGVDGSGEIRLTSGEDGEADPRWSPDGTRIVFTATRGDDGAAQIYMLYTRGGEAERLTDHPTSIRSVTWAPDGTTLFFLADDDKPDDLKAREEVRDDVYAFDENYQQSHLWTVSAETGEARRITEGGFSVNEYRLSRDGTMIAFDRGPSPLFDDNDEGEVWVMNADGTTVLVQANTGVRQELFSLEVATGAATRLTRGDHSVSLGDYRPAIDRAAVTVTGPSEPGDVWLLEPGGGALERVTSVNEDVASRFRLPRVEAIRWSGEDGVTVEGLLYYPLDYEAGTRHPLVVQTHGGPASSGRFRFPSSHNYETVLTGLGYFVLKPNYRGSTGYGDDFLRNMVGNYFDQAHKDVMAGVDHLIDEGLVDGDRMGKMGWSAGGHMTNKIITHTDRFKAASSGAGASNWVSMYGQSDVRIYRTPWFGTTPWEEGANIDQYWQDSPLREVWKVKTPTLFLVGENDARVPMPQSVEMYRGVRHNGVPTHLYVAPRQGHGWSELRHRLYKANIELDWFERWL